MYVAARWLVAITTGLAAFSNSPAYAGDGKTGWSATLYGGPWTQRVVSQIVSDGNFQTSSAMIGLAVDRRLFRLGWGFSAGAEGQVTQNFDGYTFTTFALGLGIRYDLPTALPMSFAAYTGPSYAINPPREQYYATDRKQHAWLNYVGIEFAVAVPFDRQHWDVVARIYHRSGVWGVYSINADEGTVIGAGLRAKF